MANDSIENIPKPRRELLDSNPNFPFNLLLKVESKSVNWRNYNLKKVNYITEKEIQKIKSSNETYFSISYPIFSKDNKYARISVFEHKFPKGNCVAYIYKYKNKVWTQVIESEQYRGKIMIAY